MYGINQAVNVNSFFFKNGKSFKTFPRQIEFDNTTFTFNDGIQYIIGKGQDSVRLFDMSDGRATYRLRYESGAWTLVGTRTS
jgi:hypothetical protein